MSAMPKAHNVSPEVQHKKTVLKNLVVIDSFQLYRNMYCVHKIPLLSKFTVAALRGKKSIIRADKCYT